MAVDSYRVIVFHCSKKISSIKRRRYVDATERGMGPTYGTRRGTKAATSPSPSPAVSLDKAIDEGQALGQPPKKKFRLTVRPPAARPPSNESDTIAVSRPKRKLVKPGKYSEPGPLSDDGNDEVLIKTPRKTKAPSPAESSDLSSLDSRELSATTDITPDPQVKTSRDDYGDFMSFYIADGDEEPTEAGAEQTEPPPVTAVAKPEQKLSKGGAKRPAPQSGSMQPTSLQYAPAPMHQQQREQMQHPQQHMMMQGANHTQPAGARAGPPHRKAQLPRNSNKPPGPYHHMPAHASVHMVPQPPPPPPIPFPVDPGPEIVTLKYQAGAREWAKNVKELSDALDYFGHHPPATTTDAGPAVTAPADKLLAFLDDDSASDEDEAKGVKDEDDAIMQPGDPDLCLHDGIQFIMNALRSWVRQNQWHNLVIRIQRGEIPIPKEPVEYSLAGTKEERVVNAMRKVLESGCIRTNSLLPRDLTDVLYRLYMQIHVMINQESNRDPEWRPLSYAVQIEAHQQRLDRHRQYMADEQQRMYAQHAPHQYMMQQQQQIGMPQMPNGFPGHGPPMHYPGSGPPRPRNGPPMQQLLQHTQHQQQQRAPRAMPHQGPSSNVVQQSRQVSNPRPSSARANNIPIRPSSNDKNTGARLPFSGQSLQFSFEHPNQAAYEAFGPGAFPAPQGQSTIPNRGPMMPAPTAVQPVSGLHIHGMTGRTASPSLPRGSSAGSDSHAHPTASSVTKTPQPASGFTPVNKSTEPTTTASGGFTAVNKPTTRRSSSAVSGAEAPAPVVEATGRAKRKRKPTAGALASQKDREMAKGGTERYPHPGAVVLDE